MIYKDVLERRIRRMVISLTAEKKREEEKLSFGLRLIFDQSKALWLRILCSVLLIMSSTLLIYQTYDRFMYFYSQPIEVDVNIEQMHTVSFPQTVIVFTYTKEIVKLMKAANIPPDDVGACGGDIMMMELLKKTDYNMTDLWSAANTSNGIIQRVLVKGDEVTTLAVGSIYTPLSIGAVFDRSEKLVFRGENTAMKIKMEKPEGSCIYAPVYLSWASIDNHFDYQSTLILISGFDSTVEFTQKLYHFENRRNSPCDAEILNFVECENSCRHKVYKSYNCKFPFMPLEFDMPYCNYSENSLAAFHSAKTLFAGADLRLQSCKCIRPCDQTFFDPFIVPMSTNERVFDITIRFAGSDITVITERRIYYFSSFLADTGGNLGLCLGISLLDIIYWVHIILTKGHKPKITSFKDNDAIFRIVQRAFLKIRHTLHSHDETKLHCGWLAICHYVGILLSIILTSYLVFLRTEFFLQYPTTNVLEIKDNLTVQYPLVTVCMESKFVTIRKRWLARKKKLTSPCYPTILDFMDSELSINAHKIWKNSYSSDIMNIDTTIKAFHKQTNSKPTGSQHCFDCKLVSPYFTLHGISTALHPFGFKAYNQSTKTVALPFGNCTTYVTDPVSHADTYGDFVIARIRPHGHCNVKIILTPPDDVIDSVLCNIIPEHSKSLIGISVKVLEHDLDPGRKVTTNAAASCKEKCILQKLLKKLKCTMPYIPAMNRTLPTCNSSTEAKSVQDIYFEALGATQNCDCPRPQHELIYTYVSVSYIEDSGPTVIILALLNSRIETLFQVFSYSLEKLISAVGSSVSGFLGLSVLSVMEIVHSFCQKIKRKFDELKMSM